MKKLLIAAALLVGCGTDFEFCPALDESVIPQYQEVEVGEDCLGVAYRHKVILTAPGCDADFVAYDGELYDVIDSYPVAWADGKLGDEPVALLLYLEHRLPDVRRLQLYDPAAGGYEDDMLDFCLGLFDSNGNAVTGTAIKRTITLEQCEPNLPGAPLYAVVEGHAYTKGQETTLAGIQRGEDCRTHTYLENVSSVLHERAR